MDESKKTEISDVLWGIYDEAKEDLQSGSESSVSAATLSLIRAFEQDLLADHDKPAEPLLTDTNACVTNVVAKIRRKSSWLN